VEQKFPRKLGGEFHNDTKDRKMSMDRIVDNMLIYTLLRLVDGKWKDSKGRDRRETVMTSEVENRFECAR
jgi:hypothetical protein